MPPRLPPRQAATPETTPKTTPGTNPVHQVPAFHEGRWVALLLGLLPLGFNVLVFLYEIALVRPWACTPGPSFSGGAAKGPQSGRVFLGLTAFAYAFGGHGVHPNPDPDPNPNPQPSIPTPTPTLNPRPSPGGHGVYPEERREMKSPSSWPRVLRLTYAYATEGSNPRLADYTRQVCYSHV